MEQKENKLMNLDLLKTSFQGFFTKKISVNGKKTEQEFAKIKYAEDQTFNLLSSCFQKHLVNDTQEVSADDKIHLSNWIDKNTKATEYYFIPTLFNRLS